MTGARAGRGWIVLAAALVLVACRGKSASRPGRDGGDAGSSPVAAGAAGDAGGASPDLVASRGGTIAVTVQWPDARAAS